MKKRKNGRKKFNIREKKYFFFIILCEKSVTKIHINDILNESFLPIPYSCHCPFKLVEVIIFIIPGSVSIMIYQHPPPHPPPIPPMPPMPPIPHGDIIGPIPVKF